MIPSPVNIVSGIRFVVGVIAEVCDLRSRVDTVKNLEPRSKRIKKSSDAFQIVSNMS
jgi:hypothetical protein